MHILYAKSRVCGDECKTNTYHTPDGPKSSTWVLGGELGLQDLTHHNNNITTRYPQIFQTTMDLIHSFAIILLSLCRKRNSTHDSKMDGTSKFPSSK